MKYVAAYAGFIFFHRIHLRIVKCVSGMKYLLYVCTTSVIYKTHKLCYTLLVNGLNHVSAKRSECKMKNVLLIGDSIRMGYDKSIRESLKGKANEGDFRR